jgi:hypothetical protein
MGRGRYASTDGIFHKLNQVTRLIIQELIDDTQMGFPSADLMAAACSSSHLSSWLE